MQALSLFENKIICSTDFIDHGILSSTNGIQRKVKIKGEKLDTVTNFKYPGAVVSHNGSKPGPSCSKLTTSLVNVSLKFQTLISQIH